MKKSILAMSVLIGFSFSYADYMIIVDKTHNNYNNASVSTSEWQTVSTTCSYDIEDSEVYYGKSYNRQETCSEKQRTVTKTITDSNGNQSTETVTESRPSEAGSVTVVSVGTHLESSCKNILSFDSSFASNDGVYKISGEKNVYCDMTSDGGGWSLVAAMANDGNNYWVYNTDIYWNPSDYGDVNDRSKDYQSSLWGTLSANDVMISDYTSSKYAVYSSILSNSTLASEYNSSRVNSTTYQATRKSGTWWASSCDSDNSMEMRTFSLDSDTSIDHVNASHSRGFVWTSINNGGCSWDDTYGGISKSSNSGSSIENQESWPSNQFYTKNFSTSNAMNVYVR